MDETNELSWLIRDGQNKIRGPYRQSEVLQMIKKGQLKGKTEIARSNSYWFAIEEKNELARFFAEFNDGQQPADQMTQMTGTLTQAQESGMEVTQLVPSPKEPPPPDDGGTIISGSGGAEWLNAEYAEEFGVESGFTISVQTNVGDLEPQHGLQIPDAKNNDQSQGAIELHTPTEERRRDEMLNRATVKADTLPSERRDFQGDRPRPINDVFRNSGERQAAAAAQAPAMVSVPVAPEPAPTMYHEDRVADAGTGAGPGRKILGVLVGLALAGGVAWAAMTFKLAPLKSAPPPKRSVKVARASIDRLKRAILFFDLDSAKEMLSDLEAQSEARGQAGFYLAQAMVKKEFLYDPEAAVLSLQTARPLVKNRRLEAEVDNLTAVYGFDRDREAATDLLKKISGTYPDDAVFRYNLALSYLRAEEPAEAIPLLEPMLGHLGAEHPFLEDVAVALGWAVESYCPDHSREALCRKSVSAEEAFAKALGANPNSAKAKLGLAIGRMRKGGIKAAEGDFRAFLDEAPDLDPPTRIMNFRKLQSDAFYGFAHSQIAVLNTPSANVKASPLVMAVDSVIAALQSRGAEAGKILDPALLAAPGESNILKALGYIRWKENQYPALIEVLKDARSGFAVDLMMGKALAKTGKLDQAEKRFRSIAEAFPGRSEGYSLLGDLYSQLNRIEEAKAQYLKAIQVDPSDLVAWRGLDRIGIEISLTPELQRNLPF